MGESDFSLKLVGERYANDDGSSRQEEIARCEIGEEVVLARESDNPHDPSAVAVISRRGVKIGYLGADRCGWIGSKMDRGYDVRAIVGRVLPAGASGTLAVVLTFNLEGDDPEVPFDE